MAVKVAINGFGRIGRCFFRQALTDNNIEIVAINDLTDNKTLAHLLKYDSVHGKFSGDVSPSDNGILVNGKEIKILAKRNPLDLPWKDLSVDIVIECTGIFSKKADASKHIEAGAKKVIISAPSPDPDVTIVMGVNQDEYKKDEHHIVSNASCTTNCLAPVMKVMDAKFGVSSGIMTTIHSYTNDQKILDLPHKDMRRARAAAVSMIPTTTGAAKAVALVLPQLAGKLTGMAIRVPTPNVSVVDVSLVLNKETTVEEVNSALKDAADNELNGILFYSDEPLVSCDYNGNPASSTVDALSTLVQNKTHVKLLSWYDNETGYSTRIIDLIHHMLK
ncbi:MAG: type I glyceraldehyde-3-phosphate dehydrogenase [Candidatus Cloacimonadota bacterium]|nr:MAG: type I glyceraldehyde-3-phosphate dehydrogenase [Candidatus Cloacimonadota bacterium]